jgi:hypothetical protein
VAASAAAVAAIAAATVAVAAAGDQSPIGRPAFGGPSIIEQ